MTLIDDTCDKCGRHFDPMGDPLLTKHPEIGPYAVFCEPCERRASDDDKALNLAELRRVAEAATEGPWFTVSSDFTFNPSVGTVPADGAEYLRSDQWVAEAGPEGEGGRENASHIAAFDPPTVLALLDRLQKAEGDWFDVCAELREAQRQALAWQVRAVGAEAERDEVCDWQARAEAAEAKVAQVEALLGSSWAEVRTHGDAASLIRAALRGDA